ncbi:Na(+)-translocating NADH-quinone reductase subunit B [Bacteroidia bacterium]|nr:Na(+)-translocating NADH-quinone reductase subunit B [Bacteroidia bacterium]
MSTLGTIKHLKNKVEQRENKNILRSLAESWRAFVYVPQQVTATGAHIRDAIDLKRTMATVVIALLPALLVGMWNVGYQHYLALGQTVDFWAVWGFGARTVLPIVLVSYAVGMGIEAVMAYWHERDVNECTWVICLLVPLILPPTVPLWIVALDVSFAVLVGKVGFRGIGKNIFNPVALAHIFIWCVFPAYLRGNVWIALAPNETMVEGFSGVSAWMHTTQGGELSHYYITNMLMGWVPGAIGTVSIVAIALGGLLLLLTGIANVRIVLSVLLSGFLTGCLFNYVGGSPCMDLPAYYHLVLGGFAFGAVFVATDPITSSQTKAGKWLYGWLLGALVMLLRLWPPLSGEAVFVAILIMNIAARLIDWYLVQRNIKRRLNRQRVKK